MKIIFICLCSFFHIMAYQADVISRDSTRKIVEKKKICDEPWLQAADVEPCLEGTLGLTPGRCEGDMKDPSKPCGQTKKKEDGFRSRRRRVANHYSVWPRSVVDGNTYIPYHFTTLSDEVREVFLEAAKEFHASTCIRFVPRNESHINYLNVMHHEFGCYSFIGMVGGAQELNLQANTGCVRKGTAIHEIMHALGFYHTMSRRDRDHFIYINYDNIRKAGFEQFMKHDHGNGSVFGEAYDTQSIMHYGNYAFAKSFSAKSLISKENPDERLGQRITFSTNDLNQINKMHHCYKYIDLSELEF